MLEPKSTGYIQTLEISVFRVCVSHTELDWHWNSRHSKSQQSFGHIHNCTVCKWHALFCLEIKRFKLFLCVLKSKDLQHFIALNTRGLWLNLHPSCCQTEDDILPVWGSCWETGQDIEQSLVSRNIREQECYSFLSSECKIGLLVHGPHSSKSVHS